MIYLNKKPLVLERFGISKSTLHNRVNDGLITPPISIGARAVAWPSNEVESIVNAQIAGKSPEEIRLLVKILIEKRTEGVAA
jgi:prophage regulatory protein